MANVAGTVDVGKFFMFTPKRDNCKAIENHANIIQTSRQPFKIQQSTTNSDILLKQYQNRKCGYELELSHAS